MALHFLSLEVGEVPRCRLFVPKEAPFDIFDQAGKGRGLRLYVRRVLVLSQWLLARQPAA